MTYIVELNKLSKYTNFITITSITKYQSRSYISLIIIIKCYNLIFH